LTTLCHHFGEIGRQRCDRLFIDLLNLRGRRIVPTVGLTRHTGILRHTICRNLKTLSGALRGYPNKLNVWYPPARRRIDDDRYGTVTAPTGPPTSERE
jgi:hypothetical protein